MGSSVVRSTLVSSVSTLAPSSTLAHRPSQSIKSQSATGTALSEPLLLEKARTPLLPASTPSGFELSVIRSFSQSSFFIFIFRSSSFASDLSNLFLTIDRLMCFSGDCGKQRLMQHEFASSANGNCALFEHSPAPLSFQIANLFLLRTSAVTVISPTRPPYLQNIPSSSPFCYLLLGPRLSSFLRSPLVISQRRSLLPFS